MRPLQHFFIVFLLATAWIAAAGNQASAAGAADFIQSAAERTFSSLGEEKLSDDEREKRFRTLLLETFDLHSIARFTLGRYWRRASPQQREEYLKLFEDFVVLAYSNRFRDLTGKKFKITKVTELNEEEALVLSELVIPDRPAVRVNWRVRRNNGGYKVTDVAVEGISMSVTQRDEFAAVIRGNGGRVDGLLQALRKKTGRD